MKLQVLMPDVASQRWSCHACTRCCRELVVHLTTLDRSKIDAREWGATLGVAPYVRMGGAYVLNHRPEGGCVFLLEDGRCRIHAEHGGMEKPLACQLYPFTLEAEGEAMRAGLRFDCPSVRQNDGAPLESHRAEVSRIGATLRGTAPRIFSRATPIVRLTRGYELGEQERDQIVEALHRWLRDVRVPMAARVAGLADLAETLEAARLERMESGQRIELVTLLIVELPREMDEDDVPHEALSTPKERLFRQAVFAASESVTVTMARQSMLRRWGDRVDQLRRARRMTVGRGALPSLAGWTPQGTFELVDRARADVEFSREAADEMLTRWLRARLLGHMMFGKAHFDWPIVDGLRAVAFSMAAIGWLTRYRCVIDRRMTYRDDDLAEALAIVDRTAGRSPALGGRSARMRLSYLAADGGLRGLVERYGVVPD